MVLSFFFQLNRAMLGIELGWSAWLLSIEDNEEGNTVYIYRNHIEIGTLFFTISIPLWKFTKENQ